MVPTGKSIERYISNSCLFPNYYFIDEENCPPSLKLNDQSITPTEKSPSKGSKLKENLEPLHDTNKNDDKLETVINQLANLHSPTKEPATPNFNKVPCEEIQSDGKLPVNCSPIPSPRKVRNATVKNDNSTNKEIYSKEVFGERYSFDLYVIPQGYT